MFIKLSRYEYYDLDQSWSTSIVGTGPIRNGFLFYFCNTVGSMDWNIAANSLQWQGQYLRSSNRRGQLVDRRLQWLSEGEALADKYVTDLLQLNGLLFFVFGIVTNS